MWTLRSSYINTTLLYSFTATATTTATHQNEPMRVELIRRGSNLDKKTKKTDPLLTKCDQFRDKNCVWHFLASCQPLKFIKVYRKHVSCATRGQFFIPQLPDQNFVRLDFDFWNFFSVFLAIIDRDMNLWSSKVESSAQPPEPLSLILEIYDNNFCKIIFF